VTGLGRASSSRQGDGSGRGETIRILFRCPDYRRKE
jgi:hypothetical protein